MSEPEFAPARPNLAPPRKFRRVRILLVTQMWPSPAHPDLGSFLVPLARELEELGNEVEVVAISRRGGPRSEYARLARDAAARARRARPDVVFAHFLFPTGAAGALAARAARKPLVVMAHGQDVANLGRVRGVTLATRSVLRRSAAVIANSQWLADRLAERIPAARSKLTIADCDVLCQPSQIEPFGQATLEGMAMERSVVATTVGGPPEFVTPETGVLADPNDTAGLAAALERAATLPAPNPAARKAAAEHDVRRQAARMASVLERAIAERR